MIVSLGVKNQLSLTGVITPLSPHPHPTHPARNTHTLTRLGTKMNKELNEIVSELTDCLGVTSTQAIRDRVGKGVWRGWGWWVGFKSHLGGTRLGIQYL